MSISATSGGIALIALAIAVDLMVGDPRSLPHPVVLIGRFISGFERLWNRGTAQQRRLSAAAFKPQCGLAGGHGGPVAGRAVRRR